MGVPAPRRSWSTNQGRTGGGDGRKVVNKARPGARAWVRLGHSPRPGSLAWAPKLALGGAGLPEGGSGLVEGGPVPLRSAPGFQGGGRFPEERSGLQGGGRFHEECSGLSPPGPQRGGRALLVGKFPARTRSGGSGAPRSLLLALGAHSEAPLAGAPESPDGDGLSRRMMGGSGPPQALRARLCGPSGLGPDPPSP